MIFKNQLLTNFYNPYWNNSIEHMNNVQLIIKELSFPLCGEFREYNDELSSDEVILKNVTHSIEDVYYYNFKIYGTIIFLSQHEYLETLFRKKLILPAIRAFGFKDSKYYKYNENSTLTKIITWDIQEAKFSLRKNDFAENNPVKFFND
jgi:hypothetical protein